MVIEIAVDYFNFNVKLKTYKTMQNDPYFHRKFVFTGNAHTTSMTLIHVYSLPKNSLTEPNIEKEKLLNVTLCIYPFYSIILTLE